MELMLIYFIERFEVLHISEVFGFTLSRLDRNFDCFIVKKSVVISPINRKCLKALKSGCFQDCFHLKEKPSAERVFKSFLTFSSFHFCYQHLNLFN